MPAKIAHSSNIQNRSPWLVQVRSKPQLDQQFNFYNRKQADAYLQSLSNQGVNAKLKQLETSFQLRVRRKGVRQQSITFDTFEQAEQARLKIESDLSVSIIRDYSSATQNTLRDLMVRYRDEVVPSHKGGDVELNRINRILRTEAFVDKKLAALCASCMRRVGGLPRIPTKKVR